MDNYKIDADEMEKQRYESIKNSGNYLELTVLIGTETDTFDNRTRKITYC